MEPLKINTYSITDDGLGLDPVRLVTGDRDAIVQQVRALSPYLSDDDQAISPIYGGAAAMTARFGALEPKRYGQTRNHTDGAVTQISPYVRHGVTTLSALRDEALSKARTRKDAEKFVQQLAWRDYWQRLYSDLGDDIWTDLEDYKTGFIADDYADDLPEDIARAETGVAAMDHFLRELIETGWIHNHARLYLAGYICHFRRVKWQAGARFFLTHLLDGDPASNNLSWQWVASTFSHKPYFFNLENVQTFTGEGVDTRPETNAVLVASYEDLYARLFPHLPPKGKHAQSRKLASA